MMVLLQEAEELAGFVKVVVIGQAARAEEAAYAG